MSILAGLSAKSKDQMLDRWVKEPADDSSPKSPNTPSEVRHYWNKAILTEPYLKTWPAESVRDNNIFILFKLLSFRIVLSNRSLIQLDFHKYFKTHPKTQQLLLPLLLACVMSLAGFRRQSWQTSTEKIPKIGIVISKECLQLEFLTWVGMGQRSTS